MLVDFILFLTAAYPVVVNDSIVVVKVKEGSSVTLDCRLEISALNNIEVNWKKNSNCPISSQQILSNYSLELTNVTSSHTGTYVCEGTAKNLRDDNLCTKKTFTHLEVEKFCEYTFSCIVIYFFAQKCELILR